MELDEIVLIPVPAALAIPIVRYRDGLLNPEVRSTDSSNPDGNLACKVPDQGEWVVEAVTELKRDLPYLLVRELMDRLARVPDSWVSMPEDLPGAESPFHLRNQLSAFTRWSTKRLGHRYWPFEVKRFRGRTSFRMPGLIARWWTEC